MIAILPHGSKVALLSTEPIPNNECCIEEIAWGLSNIYRFGGMGVTVAQHSWFTSYVGLGSSYAKLMHDIHETAVTDLSTPVKEALNHLSGGKWLELESINATKFRRRYGLPAVLPSCVKEADLLAARVEITMFSPEVQRAYRSRDLEPLNHPEYQINHIWSPEESYKNFMARYNEVGGGIP